MVGASNMVMCHMFTESNSCIESRDIGILNVGILNGDIVAASNMVMYSEHLMRIEGA